MIILFLPQRELRTVNCLKGFLAVVNLATTETLLIRGKSRTIRKIQSIHYLDRKDAEIYEIFKKLVKIKERS